MKKIVVLGGGDYQLPLIRAAKQQGYYVILCDFRENIPGKLESDVHYQVDTLKYKDVISVCQQENPDGIVTNSEPAILNCTKIANELGLVSNPVESIALLTSKHLFRRLQKEVGCFCPKSFVVSNIDELVENIGKISFPIIIKPSANSGTRGTQKVEKYDIQVINKAYEECYRFSRNALVEVEEFIEMPSLWTIEGEIFVHKGKILWDGLFSTYRSEKLPMVPMTYLAPLLIDRSRFFKIKTAVEKIFSSAKIIEGEFNLEGYFNNDDEFFIIEINARQGGLFLPDFVYRHSGIDYNKLLVTTSVGDDSYWNELMRFERETKNVTNHAVFSVKSGLYGGIFIDSIIKDFIVDVIELKKENDRLRPALNATDIVALVKLQFRDIEEQYDFSLKLNHLIRPIYK